MAENTIIRLSANGPEATGLEFLGRCETENVIAGTPVETGYNYFTDATGQLTAGVWECTAYTAEFDRYPVDEFCHILSGSVDITVADGHTETFTKGECFVIPKGTRCTWRMRETMRKFYVIFEDKGAVSPE